MRKLLVVATAIGVIACGHKSKAPAKKPVATKKPPAGTGSSGSSTPVGTGSAPTPVVGVEQPEPPGPREYTYDPAKRLPAVTGPAGYKALGKPRVVRFALNAWAGWAPIVFANNGAKPKKAWKDGKGNDFFVELVVANESGAMANSVATGDLHVGWASVDMLPVMMARLQREPRAMPRIFQQVDWSNGGDGVVVRDATKRIADLRGKSIAVAQNSPGQYLMLHALLDAGLQPSDVTPVYFRDDAQAVAAFGADRKHAAVVTWAPDMYSITRAGMGNKTLVTTQTSNKLIAHVWFARADFARDNPEIVEGLVRGIFEGMEALKNDDNRNTTAALLDQMFNLPSGTGASMMTDAHWTNHAENREFFLERDNPTSFERTYGAALQMFTALKVVDQMPSYDQLADFTLIKKLAREYAGQRSLYETHFGAIATIDGINGVLTKTLRIRFAPGSAELTDDPDSDDVVEEIANVVAQMPGARVVVAGHTDGSRKGSADEAQAKELSQKRANAVRDAIAAKAQLDASRFIVTGYGWEQPADPDPDAHARNRRVEVKVLRDTTP